MTTAKYLSALELIAAPMRPDGTWNRDREACRQLAADALAEDAPCRLLPLDCRLCVHFTTKTSGCYSLVQCVDARQFKATSHPRQYWIVSENDADEYEAGYAHGLSDGRAERGD